MPLSEEALEHVSRGEMPPTLKFRATPSVGKLEVKNFLKGVYGLDVKRVHTANYQGKKKQLRLKNKVILEKLQLVMQKKCQLVIKKNKQNYLRIVLQKQILLFQQH